MAKGLDETVKVKQANDLFKSFSGMDTEHRKKIKTKTHDVVMQIGKLDGVLYTTVRDGAIEKYVHKFRPKSKPILGVSHDGKRLYVIGGKYQFTDRGIEDK